MKITELRIGNFIYFPTGGEIKIPSIVRKVDYIGYGNIVSSNPSDGPTNFEAFIKHCAPIPLCDTSIVDTTRDIYIESEYDQAFIRFEHCNERNAICAVLRDIDEQQIGTKKYYVHELQNLYFALTGNELILK